MKDIEHPTVTQKMIPNSPTTQTLNPPVLSYFHQLIRTQNHADNFEAKEAIPCIGIFFYLWPIESIFFTHFVVRKSKL